MTIQDNIFMCTGIDDGFVWPWMVSIYSASVKSRKKFDVGLGVIKGQFGSQNLKLIQAFCNALDINLIYREFDFNFRIQLNEHLPVQSYIRMIRRFR